MKPFRKILIANRGEIASRVMRACRAMGIATVAVYSDADCNAPHVRFADEAAHLGAAPAKDSYLNAAKIIEAAKRTGADAIHPGYGFLSENAEFAEACAAAGIVFIGPQPEAIRKMGLKSSARKLAARVGAPVVPGYNGDAQDDESLREEILKIGFPVLIKASAGGGGKGMRVVPSEAEIAESIESARREAEKAFGNGALLLEKFIEGAHHVEIQILGDQHGNLVHLFERDCSLQRRHQKIIEESPSPAVNDELRRVMGETAVNIGKAIGYTNAGTVEFILSPTGEFYFIEVNTRLQVEHPVTEMITGLDLVKLQIEIAEGKPLPFSQSDLKTRGHAIEARLYAEEPGNNFLPTTGKIRDWRLPEIDGLRVDSGVETGSEVGIYYDPMLAKLIAHADDRQTAIRKLSYALRQVSIQGMQTNREFLIRLLEHDEFQHGEAHTGFIAEHLEELIAGADEKLERASVVAAALYLQQTWQLADSLLAQIPPNYRNNPFRNPSIKLKIGEQEVEISWRHLAGNRFELHAMGTDSAAEIIAHDGDSIRLALDGVQREFRIIEADGLLYVHSSLGSSVITRLPRHPVPQSASQEGTASSPMPGQVLKILVSEGQQVAAGDALLILEAMKMEQTIRAAFDGIVESVNVTAGQVVSPGDALVRIAAQKNQ